MKLMNFFKSRKNETGESKEKNLDSATDEPQEVITENIALHTEPPTGTRFNRKLIMILAALAAVVGLFAMLSALQPAKKLTPQEIAEKNMIKKEPQTSANPVTPDIIANAPDNYAKMQDFENEKKLRQRQMNPNNQFQQGVQPAGQMMASGQTSFPAGSRTMVPNIGAVSPASLDAYGAQAGLPVNDLQKEIIESRKSPIKFPGMAGQQQPAQNQQSQPAVGIGPVYPPSVSIPKLGGHEDQNMQDEKREFVEKRDKPNSNIYVKGLLLPPLSRYELKAGNIIPGVMITGINSDLPGGIVGQVRENVYDTVSGRYLLIPQGTRIVGMYDSKVSYAQERVLIVWTRLIFPNGSSIDLEGMNGVDLSGYAGLNDTVNNHYAKLVTGVVLSTILSVGTKVSAGNNDIGQASIGQQAAAGAAMNISSTGEKFTDRYLNVQPTIEIRPGWKFNVFINKDIILRPYRG